MTAMILTSPLLINPYMRMGLNHLQPKDKERMQTFSKSVKEINKAVIIA